MIYTSASVRVLFLEHSACVQVRVFFFNYLALHFKPLWLKGLSFAHVDTHSAAKQAIMFSLVALHVRFSRHRSTITVISLKARAALLTHSNSSSSPSPCCCADHVFGSAPIREQQSQRELWHRPRILAAATARSSFACRRRRQGACFDEVARIL